MKNALLFLYLLLPITAFSQEISIATNFIEDGVLHEGISESSKVLIEFKENDDCTVIDYVGKDIYKVKYNDFEGFLSSDFLEINEDMMDLYYDFQEKERVRVIQERENRKKKIQDIVWNSNAEKEKRRQDSLANAETLKQAAAEAAQELARQQAIEKENERLEAIAKAEAIKKQEEAAQELARQQAIEKENERLEAIAKAAALKKAEEAAQELARQHAIEKENERLEAIAKAAALKKVEQAAQELAHQQAIEKENKRFDSIANVEFLKKQELARKLALAIEQKRKDSITNIKEIEKQKFYAEQLEKQRVVERERNRLDSIAKIEAEKKIIATRNSCNYLINEYDEFYKEELIRTEPYHVSENLTIELYKQGRSKNIFFNLPEELGCVSYLSNNRSSIKVQLENNQTVTFYHSWDVDCGVFSFKGRLSTSNITKLKTSPIKSIKLRTTQTTRNITNITYKTFFIDKLNCLN